MKFMKPSMEVFVGLPNTQRQRIRKGVLTSADKTEMLGYIMDAVCNNCEFTSTYNNKYKITEAQIKSKERKREIVIAKQLFIYFAREKTQLGYKRLATAAGLDNHATAHYAVNQVVKPLVDGTIMYPEMKVQYLRCKPVIDNL